MPVFGLIGSGIGRAMNAGEEEVKNDWLQNPEYPENTAAREKWWSKLQEWEKDPNYGAITPDWGNIWETVQRRVKEYYEGSAMSPGVKDRIRSSLARRGISESPASDLLLARADAEMGGQLKDIATQQGITRAELAEQGRRTWLGSLQDLEARKPTGQWQTRIVDPNAKQNAIYDLIGGTSAAIISAGAGMAGADLDNMHAASQYKAPQQFTSQNYGIPTGNVDYSMKTSQLYPSKLPARTWLG